MGTTHRDKNQYSRHLRDLKYASVSMFWMYKFIGCRKASRAHQRASSHVVLQDKSQELIWRGSGSWTGPQSSGFLVLPFSCFCVEHFNWVWFHLSLMSRSIPGLDLAFPTYYLRMEHRLAPVLKQHYHLMLAPIPRAWWPPFAWHPVLPLLPHATVPI